MAEDLQIARGTKTEQYAALLPQIGALIEGENDGTANLANIAAALVGVPTATVERQMVHFAKADPDYAKRITAKLGKLA